MIKKRNLDNSLIQWIMTVTGLGPGIGEMFWVAPRASATSQFKTQLEDDLGVSDNIYATPIVGEVPMVAYRNDVMLVMPGNYLQTASIAWGKANSHMIGLAGPSIGGDYGDASGVNLYTTTAAVADCIHITGKTSQFLNMGFDNNGAATTNRAGAKIDAAGVHMKNCTIIGNMNGTQAANANCASLKIDGGGHYPVIENCTIGSDVWGARSAASSGQILFADNSQPNDGLFRNCVIRSESVTAAACMVVVNPLHACGRGWIFDNCGFINVAHSGGAQGTTLTQAFYLAVGDAGVEIFLHNCYAAGLDQWQTSDQGKLMVDMPITGTGGGLMKEPTGATGA